MALNPDRVLCRAGNGPLPRRQCARNLKRLKQAGLTVLLVEQNVHLALALSDHAYAVAEGRMVMEGMPKQLAAKPEIRKAYLRP